MKVIVEPEHIDRARSESTSWLCPIDFAVMGLLNHKNVITGFDSIWIKNRAYSLPERVREWIAAYDEGEDVRPIAFELPLEP